MCQDSQLPGNTHNSVLGVLFPEDGGLREPTDPYGCPYS